MGSVPYSRVPEQVNIVVFLLLMMYSLFYVSEPAEMNADAIRGFLESYASGALKGERQQLKG